jgi:hypothetical protein
VPAHCPASRQERVERGEVRGRITAERVAHDSDKPLYGAQTGTAGLLRDRRCGLAEHARDHIEVGEQRPDRGWLIR